MAEVTETQEPVEAEVEKPRRRTRRTAKAAVEAEQPAAPEPEKAEKPKRTRTRKAKAAPEASEEPAVEAAKPAQEEPAQDAARDEKPQGEPRSRVRRSRKVTVSDTASGEGAEKSDTSAEGDSKQAAKAEQKQPKQQKPGDAQRAERAERNDRADRADRNDRNDRNGKQNNQRHNRRNRNREIEPSVTREELEGLKVADLRARAAELEVDATGLKKAELVDAVFDASVKAEGFLEVGGVLDILSDGYGFLRTTSYLPGDSDCYMGTALIKRNGLRKGDYIVGQTRPIRDNEKFAAIQKVISVNGVPIEQLGPRPRFADLTPVYPEERLVMEHGHNTTTARVIDLVAPIGKGQRGLIVSPPKAGKTTILKDIAAAIHANNPEVHLMCLLVDERPEEVTDMQRSIHGEVISSTFDMPADNHIAVAEMVIERAKRLVEGGKDVVILLDSITRLARAYNLAQPASGRVLSGGVDSTALYPPKRFLGAARNIEFGGSLTILASALIETGSKMDEVIFEEFKGTGNMELRLDRQLADRRIFPAIDPVASGTRKEELLLDSQMAPIIWAVRRILANMNNTERAMDMLIKSIKQTDDNQEFLLRMARKAQHGKTETLEL